MNNIGTEPTTTAAATTAAQQGNDGANNSARNNGQQQAQVQTQAQTAEKTFTQSDVDRIVAERLSRAKKGMPTEDELNAFNEWKSSQKTEEQKAAEREQEYAATKNKLTQAEQRWKLVESGYNPANGDDFDYLLYKLGKDDKLTVEELIKSIPPKTAATKKVNSSSSMNSSGASPDEQSARLRKAAGLK